MFASQLGYRQHCCTLYICLLSVLQSPFLLKNTFVLVHYLRADNHQKVRVKEEKAGQNAPKYNEEKNKKFSVKTKKGSGLDQSQYANRHVRTGLN